MFLIRLLVLACVPLGLGGCTTSAPLDASADTGVVSDASVDTGVASDASNATCVEAIALTPGVETSGTTIGGGSAMFSCAPGAVQTEIVFYKLAVPPMSRARLAFDIFNRAFVRVFRFDSCEVSSCVVAGSTGPITPGPIRDDVVNDTAVARTFVFAVAPTSGSAAFSIRPTVIPLARNATCSTAAALRVGAPPIAGELANGGTVAASCAITNVLFYEATVPANSQGLVTLSSASGLVRARVLTSCADAGCVGNGDFQTRTVTLTNPSATARSFVLEVSSTAMDDPFSIAYTSTAALAVSCALPRALAVGEIVAADTSTATSTATCSPSDQPQLYFAASIPPNARGTFTITRTGAADVRARILGACGDAACERSTVTVDATPKTFFIDNFTTAAITRRIAVSGTVGPATFSLSFAGISAAPRNVQCDAPVFVVDSATAIDTAIAAPPVGCDLTDGPVLYYRAIVDGSSRATLTLTRTGATNMRMRLLDECGSASCAMSIATTSATPVSMELTNTSPAMRGFLIAVGAAEGSASVGTATIARTAQSPL